MTFEQEVRAIAASAEGGARYLVFAPGLAVHPLADAEQTFTTAAQDLGEDALLFGETPLLFVGFVAKNLFARKVESVGFLLTDAGLYVRDTPTIPIEDFPIRHLELDEYGSSAQLVTAASATFDRRWALTLTDDAALKGAVEVLRRAADIVLSARQL